MFSRQRVQPFLAKLREGSSVSEAARAMGATPRTVQRWQQQHVTFRESVVEAKIDGLQRELETLRQRAADSCRTRDRNR